MAQLNLWSMDGKKKQASVMLHFLYKYQIVCKAACLLLSLQGAFFAASSSMYSEFLCFHLCVCYLVTFRSDFSALVLQGTCPRPPEASMQSAISV